MPIRSVERLYDGQEEIGIRLNGVGKDGYFEVLYADIPGNSWNANRLGMFTQRAQDLIDYRIPLTDLPVDHPDRVTDPSRPDYFHDSGDLVARPVFISGVAWDGNRLDFVLSKPGTDVSTGV
jgi:hypothetical protein